MEDKLLLMIIGSSQMLADKTDGRFEPSITIVCGGVIVSGIIISAREYVRSSSILDTIGETFDEVPRQVGEPSGFENLHEEGFIHLREAQFFFPGQVPIPANGMYFRARIADINGYTFNRFQVSK